MGVVTVDGIYVDSWVQVDDRCDITCDVSGNEVHFQFGDAQLTGLYMIVAEESLEKLVHMSMDALRRMRAESDDEGAEIKTA